MQPVSPPWACGTMWSESPCHHRTGTLTLIHPTTGESENAPPSEFTHSQDAADKAGNDGVTFRYDPSDPTPTLGGRTLSGSMGVKDNRPLESRPDVRSFTTDPLPTFKLTIYDRPTHYVLWTISQTIDPANLQKTHDKNFDTALDSVVQQFEAITK